jgi:hypothetical protein
MRRRSLTGFVAAAVVAAVLGAGTLFTLAVGARPLRTVSPPAVSTSSVSTSSVSTSSASTDAVVSGEVGQTPVYAYFYQWFTPSSWRRAKVDYPLRGRYSSDDVAVLREQVREARTVGISGFLTSWKDTPALDRRLDRLIRVAQQWNFDVGVVYEALDFSRRPLPVATVESGMRYLVARWGQSISSRYYGRPVIIWTGTDQYTREDVQQVRDALGTSVRLLAAAKSVSGYERIADLVDGEAYYWSSADPTSPATSAKLAQMSAAVHAHHGIWIAPAPSGFDGTTLGHTRVIARNGGATLRTSLDDAYASKPDAVAVISWNEWSENTYIEPGSRYGSQELTALQDYLAQHHRLPAAAEANSAVDRSMGWSGLRASGVLAAGCVLGGVALVWRTRATRPRRRIVRHRARRRPVLRIRRLLTWGQSDKHVARRAHPPSTRAVARIADSTAGSDASRT